MNARINILNKTGLLSEKDRKAPLEHGCDYFMFKTCLDLSEPIQVIPYGNSSQVPAHIYARNIASFICWWTNFVFKDLNGFSGFHNIKFQPIGFEIIN